MSTKLYIVEGLPCSGKSSTAAHIAHITGGELFDEGCGDHPADYEFSAFIPDGVDFSVKKLSEEYAQRIPGGVILPLNKLSGEDFDRALKYKIYDGLDWETERPVMLDKWRGFAANAGDTVYVFNCVLLQNPMCETMMRFNLQPEESLEYITEICNIIAPLDPTVIYLKCTDISAQIRSALPERGTKWLNAVVDYHCNGGYGTANGLSGFDGYISALKERQKRELDFLPCLPVKSVILEDAQLDWGHSYRKIDEILANK